MDPESQGEYDPYTVGELGSDLKQGAKDTMSSLFGGDKASPRAQSEIQADIDETNMALRAGEISNIDAMKQLKGYDDENAAAGYGRGMTKPDALYGTAIDESRQKRKKR
jgi:hypothetical protein